MGFGLYKPGQGYWVRVLTAAMAGVVTLAAAAWLWNELQKATAYIPRPTYTVTMSSSATGGPATPGQSVALLGEPQANGQREQIGTATVETFDSGTSHLTFGKIQMAAGRDASAVRAIGPGAGGGATLSGPISGNATGNPMFEPLYLQAAGVSLMILLGFFLTFYFVGVSPKTVEFLIATDGEMKKVNWSSRRDIIGSTWVVILWSVLLAGGLWVVDFLFQAFFKLIGVLQS